MPDDKLLKSWRTNLFYLFDCSSLCKDLTSGPVGRSDPQSSFSLFPGTHLCALVSCSKNMKEGTGEWRGRGEECFCSPHYKIALLGFLGRLEWACLSEGQFWNSSNQCESASDTPYHVTPGPEKSGLKDFAGVSCSKPSISNPKQKLRRRKERTALKIECVGSL